ncbi:hypothetical protein P1X14_03095 [Sphingomonas sp. AOB5]|uniref:hypothetical protein n=1 Tax=Sphingomonas sp. AOB5 TaxID=3034017 RepID=UPI0023F88B65|nr:hypothetical protein [Sphingomonas sp. AOB5]MDF7774224.1 hypothetical protein [Sphingomonas sp. AOB5]
MFLAAAAALLLTGAAPQSAPANDFACRADFKTNGPHRATPLTGPPYAVTGRLKVERKEEQGSHYAASAYVQIMSYDGRDGVYLIVSGQKEFLGGTVEAELVSLRGGKRHDYYQIGVFKTGVPTSFSLSLDEKGLATARFGSRTVKLRSAPLPRAAAVMGCSLGSFTFSELTPAIPAGN